jgi:hypothetical protein
VPLVQQFKCQLEVMLRGANAFVSPGDASLDSHERAVLDRALYRTYAAGGITSDRTTDARPVPILRDLAATLRDLPREVAGSVSARLERFVGGSLSAGLFAGPTNVELDRASSCSRFATSPKSYVRSQSISS